MRGDFKGPCGDLRPENAGAFDGLWPASEIANAHPGRYITELKFSKWPKLFVNPNA